MMAANKERTETARLIAERLPVELTTENGFTIVRRCEIDPATVDSTAGCHFLVRDPAGTEVEVTVVFNTEMVELIQKQRATPFSSTCLFWLECAERALARHLWQTDNTPPDGWLVVFWLSPADLILAASWA